MSMLRLDEINVWAALVAGVASFVVGGLWYGALFARAWTRAYGYSPETLAAMSKSPAKTYATLFAGDVLFGLGLAVVASAAGVASMMDGVVLGLVIGIGVVGALGLATHVGNGRPIAGFLIDGGKQLASLVVAGAIVGAWR